MMRSSKLTKRYVESIDPSQDEELLIWDSEIKGFGVRIFSTGRRTYFVQYRNQFGRTRRKKIGVHGAITCEQARDEAKKILGQVASGNDPSEEVKLMKKKEAFSDLTEQYLKLHAQEHKRARSMQNDQSMIDRILLPKFGMRKLEEISTHDIQSLQHELKDTPYQANRTRSLLSKMFNLAKSWGWVTSNPVEGVSKYQELKRERWLDENEIQRLWEALNKYENHLTSYAIKLLLLTGARRGEVLNATWDQFDLDKGVWTKPSHLTKQKKSEHLPLSTSAIDVLKDLKSRHPSSSPFLFPSKVEGQPLQEVKRFWASVLKEAGIENCRIHDLRHTHASHLVSSGLSLSIIGKLLGHTQASTTQRYAHLADEPLREAAELFGSKVGKQIKKPSNNEAK